MSSEPQNPQQLFSGAQETILLRLRLSTVLTRTQLRVGYSSTQRRRVFEAALADLIASNKVQRVYDDRGQYRMGYAPELYSLCGSNLPPGIVKLETLIQEYQ